MNISGPQIPGIVAAGITICTALGFLCKKLIERRKKKKEREQAITAKLETIEKILEDMK